MSHTIVDTTVIKSAVHRACRAPSFHNSQPWRWVLADGILRLYLDRNHLVPIDLSGRQALLSCGAALDHVQVAMAAAGWYSHVDRLPNPNDSSHLASLTFTSMATVTPGHHRRADAIVVRHTDRLPFTAPTGWNLFVEALEARLEDADAYVDTIDTSDRERLAEASELIDILHLYDSAYHAELNWRTSPYAVNDGIPKSALVSATERHRVDVGRSFPASGHQNRRPEIRQDRAQILVISARDETTYDILRCGETLSKVLLEATMAGMATCTVTHLTEQKATSNVVSALTGRALPQVLIRVGLAPALEDPPPPTPRRPLSDVFTLES
jgi:nitroreductase